MKLQPIHEGDRFSDANGIVWLVTEVKPHGKLTLFSHQRRSFVNSRHAYVRAAMTRIAKDHGRSEPEPNARETISTRALLDMAKSGGR